MGDRAAVFSIYRNSVLSQSFRLGFLLRTSSMFPLIVVFSSLFDYHTFVLHAILVPKIEALIFECYRIYLNVVPVGIFFIIN